MFGDSNGQIKLRAKQKIQGSFCNRHSFAQSAGAVEYTDCAAAEVQDPSNECPGYDT